ncbi:hypothetical protein [Dokdonella sp.]|uniref:hypothetical protein n=1 Tax=Dokdonella sp. TaxID=2291710 RepID=UPI002F428ED3
MNATPLRAALAAVFASAVVTPCALAQVHTPAASPWRVDPSRSVPAPGPIVTGAFPTEGWTSRTVMPSARWGHAMASYMSGTWPDNDAYVYVISGGDASFANTSLMSRYDVTFDSWADLAPMTPARLQIGAARVGTKIYVPGGYAGSFAPTSILSVYDIVTGLWQPGPSLLQATGDYAIGSYADRYVYVIGGYSGSADLNTVQVFDTAMNAWSSATPKIGSAVAGLRGAIVGNHIIVVGGYSQALAASLADAYVGTIDSGDPNVITWAPIASYPGGTVGRLGVGVPVAAGPALGASGLDIVIFTGGDPDGGGISVKHDSWIYDFNDGAWKSGPDKPTGVSNIGTIAGVASGGKLHLVSTGGYDGVAVVNVNEWLTLGDEAPPDLALAGSANGATVDPGGTLVYTLDYSVGVPGSAADVTITESVPTGTTFNATASSAGWTCVPDGSAGSDCVYSLGTLAGGASGSVQFAVDTIYPVPAGLVQIDNDAAIATVAPFGPEQDLANNSVAIATPFTGGAVQVAPLSGLVTTESGGTAQFDVVLQLPPSADVTIDFASNDPSEGLPSPTRLVFTPADWNVPQTIVVTGVGDFLADGDVAYSIIGAVVAGSGNYDGVALPTVSLVNVDEVLDRIFADGFDP